MNPPRRSPRILMTTDAVGGVWVFSTLLASGLANRGYDVNLVVLGPAPRQSQLQALHGTPGIAVTVAEATLEWADPFGREIESARAALGRIAESYAPDLVHLNSYREAVFDWPAPVLVTGHSCLNSWWRACRGGSYPAPAEWKSYSAAVRAGLAAADCWAAPSATMRDWIAKIYKPPRCGHVVLNGIEPMRFRAQKRPVILAAGRLWDEAKNIAALDAVAADIDWPIRVAGPVEVMERSYVHRDDTSLELIGELPRGKLLAEMAHSEVFAAPALYEPFGLTVVEAAMAGCALVLSDIPTLRELWDGAAVFVEPTNRSELRATLKALIANPELRGVLRDSARKRALTYTLDQTVKSYARLYGHMLRESRHSGVATSPFSEAAQ